MAQKVIVENSPITFSNSRAKILNNPLGSILGSVASFYVARKYFNIENKWALGGISVIGLVVGAYTTSALKRTSILK